MKGTPHKTTPKVRGGKVQKKDRHAPTKNYWNTSQRIPVFDREKPGRGYKHFLRKNHLIRFIQLLPDWDELSTDLNAIVLAEGGCDFGWWSEGVVAICAWPRDGVVSLDPDIFMGKAGILRRLRVNNTKQENRYVCSFSEPQVRAFQLLDTLLHELGHHHDRDPDRGERYAEDYAHKYGTEIWSQYIDEFQLEDS